MRVTIAREPVRQEGVIALLEQSDAYMATLYPAESNHLLDITSLENLKVSFFVARRNGEIVGCCALVEVGDGTAEIKRMFVSPDARGLAIGRLIMEALEDGARTMGLGAIRLEMGIIPKITDDDPSDRIDFGARLGETRSRTTRSGENFRQRPSAQIDRPRRGGMEIGHRRASKSSTDAKASLCGFSYPDDRFQAIGWLIISDLWYKPAGSHRALSSLRF